MVCVWKWTYSVFPQPCFEVNNWLNFIRVQKRGDLGGTHKKCWQLNRLLSENKIDLVLTETFPVFSVFTWHQFHFCWIRSCKKLPVFGGCCAVSHKLTSLLIPARSGSYTTFTNWDSDIYPPVFILLLDKSDFENTGFKDFGNSYVYSPSNF